MKKLILFFLLVLSISVQSQTWPTINTPSNQISFGTNRPLGWWATGDAYNGWYTNGVWNYLNLQGSGESNSYFYAYSWVRWPGVDNGVSKTIWFKIGYDDKHHLAINNQLVASGECCGWSYGAYSARPGEIVKIEFWSYNEGGSNWEWQVAWDPSGTGYELLGTPTTSYVNESAGGGSYWYTSDITQNQLTLINSIKSRLNSLLLGNKVEIDAKTGTTNPSVTIEQSGDYNLVQSILSGMNDVLDIKQGSISGKNIIDMEIYGNTNTVNIWQSRDNVGSIKSPESGGHYMGLGINGSNNLVSIKQSNDGSAASGHTTIAYITGNSNTFSVLQSNDNEKKIFGTINGTSNSLSLTQQGLGNHFIDASLFGTGNTLNVIQRDSGSHKTTINLQNINGPSNLTLIQQGVTGQTYSIFQQCTNTLGCAVNVIQGQ